MRSLRAITFRAAPDDRELSLLRAMALEVVRFLERTERIERSLPEHVSPRPGPAGEPVSWRVYQDPAGHPFCLVLR